MNQPHVLVDVDIESSQLDLRDPASGHMDGWRETVTIPSSVSRSRFLELMDLTDFCNTPDRQCDITHRGLLWSLTDSQEISILTGDFIMVHIYPIRANQGCILSPHSQQGNQTLDLEEGMTHSDRNSLSLIQLAARFSKNRSFSELGWSHVPPPGNGNPFLESFCQVSTRDLNRFSAKMFSLPSKKKVSFHPTVEVIEFESFDLDIDDKRPTCREEETPPINSYMKDCCRLMSNLSNPFVAKCRQRCLYPDARTEQTIWTPSGPVRKETTASIFATLPSEYRVHKIWLQDRWQFYIWDSASEVYPVFFFVGEILRCHHVAKLSRFWEIDSNIHWSDRAMWKVRHVGQFLGCFQELAVTHPSTTIPFQKVQEAADHVISMPLPWVNTFEVEWHASTALAFHEVRPWDLEDSFFEKYAFFTDGSTGQISHGSAAVVALGYWKGQCFWLGAIALSGPNQKRSGRMETLALQLALTWAVQLVHRHRSMHAPLPGIHIGFDSTVAGFTAAGIWNSHANQDLQTWNRAVVYWLQTILPHANLTWEHIHSHEGHPWNEAADTIASLTASGRLTSSNIEDWESQMNTPLWATSIQWIWTLEDPQFLPLLERRHGELQLCIPLPSNSSTNDLIHPFQYIAPERADGPQHRIDCKIASANVLTLFPDKQGEPWTGSFTSARIKTLLTMFRDQSYLIVGIQESRMKFDGYRDLDEWHLLSGSATEQGHGGTQLWIRKRWPHSTGEIQVDNMHLRILFSGSDLLVVRFAPPGLRLLLIVGHAPSAATDEEASQFWKHVTKCIPSSYNTWRWIGFFDANARVGSFPSDYVGSHDAEIENAGGRWFHEWLHTNSIVLPATFDQFHKGQSWTWTHSNGTSRSRLDYIGVSADLRPHLVQSFIEDTIDLTITRQDHMVVALSLDLWMDESPPTSRRRYTLDTDALQTCINQDILAGKGQSWTTPISSVPWTTNVHDHAAILDQGTQQILPWLPRPERIARKKHLTESTWQLISMKSLTWRALGTTKKAYRRDLIFLAFKAWKTRSTQDLAPLRWLCWREAFLMYHYRRLCRQVTAGVRQDDKCFYEDLAQKAGDADGLNHNTSLWKAIKAVLPRQVKRRKDSTLCQTPSKADLHDHFDHLEAGEKTDYATLLAKCRQAQQEAQHEVPLQLSLESLPTRFEIEQLCKKVQMQKAPGIDGVPQAWLKLGSPLIAVHLHALLLKCWVSGQEPLQFKGGLLHPLWKKGSKADASNYRGITLLESYGKRWHAFLRSRLLHRAQSIRTTGQLGGFPRQQTGFASLYLRSFASLTDWKRFSEAVIFFDIRGAFHHLLRELTFNPSTPFPPALIRVLEEEGIPWQDLHAQVQTSDLKWLTEEEGLHRAICDAHSFTWTHFKGDPTSLRQTHRGTRPGSPLADLAFNCLMSRVLGKIQDILRTDSDLQEFVQITSFEIHPLAWVDDIAIPLAYSNYDRLLEKVRFYTLLVKRVMLSLGFLLNMDKGKTEAVLTFRGRGAPQKCNEIYLHEKAVISLDEHSALHVVSDYKHLGARFSQHAKFDREISIRLAEAQTAFRTLRKHIFTNRRISVTSRLRLLESLVLSKLLYNSGFWPLLKPTQLQRLDACIIRWQRTITGDGLWHSQRISNAMFLRLNGLPSIEARLNRNRLLGAFQVIRNSADFAWPAVLCADQTPGVTWLTLVRRALESFQDIEPSFGPLSPTTCSPSDLEQWLHIAEESGPTRTKRLFKRHLLQEKAVAEALFHHQCIHRDFEEHGFRFREQIAATDEFNLLSESFSCMECARSFATRQALQAHRWRQYQQISLERQYVDGPVCRACGIMFWTSQRVQQHLRQSRKLPDGCFQKLFLHLAPSKTPVRWNVQSPWQHIHNLPQLYVGGDLQGLPSTPEEERSRKLAEWSQKWTAQGYPEVIPDSLYEAFHQGIDCATFAWLFDGSSDLIFNWGSFLDRFAAKHGTSPQVLEWCFYIWYRFDMEAAIDHVSQTIQNQVIRDAADLYASYPIYPLLQQLVAINETAPLPPPLPDVGPSAKGTHERLDGQVNHWYSRQAELMRRFAEIQVDYRPELPGVPYLVDSDGQRCFIITHLFSGRRREFDCHHWFEVLGPTYLPGWRLLLLSFDTAIHPTLGNLDSGPNWEKVLGLAKKGVIAANLTGPPCETYSAARHLPPPETMLPCIRWPRPLRHPQRLWGLDGLSQKELRQVHMGSRLLLHSARIEVLTTLGGGGSAMEHPAPRKDTEIPSSWSSPALHRYASQLEAQRHYVEQYKYGATGVKPTLLRSLNLARFHQVHETADESAQRPTQGLQGVDAHGRWRTAYAKEYPSELNKGLAIGVLASLRLQVRHHHLRACSWETLGELLPWLEEVAWASMDNHGAHFLPDYQGR